MGKNGFTLAEVLITLGIIGIVAAITIPVLMQNIQDYQFKQAWKKEYSVISQAYSLMKQDNGGSLNAYFDDTHTQTFIGWGLLTILKNYLLTLQTCNINCCSPYPSICNNSNSALNTAYKTLSGSIMGSDNFYYAQYVLKDGANVLTRAWGGSRIIIWVDVNGYAKGPNILGRDLFGAVITKDKIMPMGAAGTGTENSCTTTTFNCPSSYANGFGSGDCAGAGCSMDALSQ